MSDQEHIQEGQRQRAKRLREQIESLKSGRPAQSEVHGQSLREQIEERAHKAGGNPFGERDASGES